MRIIQSDRTWAVAYEGESGAGHNADRISERQGVTVAVTVARALDE